MERVFPHDTALYKNRAFPRNIEAARLVGQIAIPSHQRQQDIKKETDMGGTVEKPKRNQTLGTGDMSTQETRPETGAHGRKSKAGPSHPSETDSKNFVRRVSRELME